MEHKHEWREYKDEGSRVLCVCSIKGCLETKIVQKSTYTEKLLDLWKEYASDKEVLSNPNIPPGFPVLSIDGFISWLIKNHKNH